MRVRFFSQFNFYPFTNSVRRTSTGESAWQLAEEGKTTATPRPSGGPVREKDMFKRLRRENDIVQHNISLQYSGGVSDLTKREAGDPLEYDTIYPSPPYTRHMHFHSRDYIVRGT